MIGETGSGKSTLINYLTNYFYGGSVEKLEIAIPTQYLQATRDWEYSEKDLHDSMQSKTTECNIYSFKEFNSCYKFIDTPGFSDTKGTEQDDQHISKITSAAEKLKIVTTVIIVINGAVGRVTATTRNTLALLRSSVPDILLNNLIVVLTNCSPITANFDLKALEPWTVPEDHVFYMNNSALSKPTTCWINNEKMKKLLIDDWETSMDEIKKMILTIENMGHINTNVFGDMRRSRNKIKAKVSEILIEVKHLQNLQSELDSAELAHKGISTDIEEYSNYKQNKQVEYIEMEETEYFNTICMNHTDKVCHENCGLNCKTGVGDSALIRCSCIKHPQLLGRIGQMVGILKAECHVCKCAHTAHYHDNKKPVKKIKTVEEILQDVKARYDQNTRKNATIENKINALNVDIQTLQEVLKKKETEIHRWCQKLKEICSQFNFIDELKSVIDTMKANARGLTSMKARSEADNMINNIEKLADELQK